MRRWAAVLLLTPLLAGSAVVGRAPGAEPGSARPDPIRSIYKDYVPPYVDGNTHHLGEIEMRCIYRGWRPSREERDLSTEKAFFSLNVIHQDDRANALVEAAADREAAGRYRDALKMYQIIIDKYPRALFRVSEYGVFVPVAQYAQRRLLNFPRQPLEHYQTLFDARARESFRQAKRNYSLIGFSEIADRMLATSYGDNALFELGNAALDQGHHLEALEYYTSIRDYFRRSELLGKGLDLRIALCRKLLGLEFEAPPQESAAEEKPRSPRDAKHMTRLRQVVAETEFREPDVYSQRASDPYASADDYALFPKSEDPLALKPPVWEAPLPATRGELRVHVQPVATKDSIIYRHKNILYCRSLLNGDLRWKNDLGGRVMWQSRNQRQYPMESVLVQDGLVFTPMHKVGPSLLALDEVTGQLRWAYGPVVAATAEEARMRFESAPAGGPRSVYAGYVLDNIQGESHTDTEYGIIAFESTTGRIRWRKTLCRLQPGEFAAGFAVARRNRIQSFSSPPLYHQGTVYYCTNAGAVVALDARSGRIKWLMRCPYYAKVHDAMRPFGGLPSHGGRLNPHGSTRPMFWFNQRPLIVGERLYVMPVDTPLLLCIDRKTGRVLWKRIKVRVNDRGDWFAGSYTWLLGPTKAGHLVLAHSGRGGIVQLLDRQTGKTVWTSPDPIKRDDKPCMRHPSFWCQYRGLLAPAKPCPGMSFNRRFFYLGARPFLTRGDELFVSHWVLTGPYGMYPPWCFNLAHISLGERKVLDRRRYYTPRLLNSRGRSINHCKHVIENVIPDWPEPRKKENAERIQMIRDVANDTPPVNRYGPFLPFARLTADRYGVRFELRISARRLAMYYDAPRLEKRLAGRDDPRSTFAQAELAVAAGRLREGAARLRHCLGRISSEDLDLRATINQILYQVHKRLARSAIRAGDRDRELQHALGMARTGSTLADEIETLFALADAYDRQGQPASAARALRSIIDTYGHYEHPVPSVVRRERKRVLDAAGGVLDRARRHVDPHFFRPEFSRTLALLEKSLPLYFSAVSPLPKDLTARAGDLAIEIATSTITLYFSL
ncbi:MAG: PQQ-binding-like beta-propeller repeat protein [Planctomycetota bacterium]